MTPQRIIQLAQRIGLSDCAIVPAEALVEDGLFMDEWIARSLHGNLDYLERHRAERYDPRVLVPGAKTMVIALLRFSDSKHDYHRSLKSKLYDLEKRMREEIDHPDEWFASTQHIFCDSAPMLERRWAERAGLGTIGRNHQLIHPQLGSLVHIGELVLQQEVETCLGCAKDFHPCQDCHRCEETCPGQALGRDEWDVTRCIAYETHKCLECQINCPYNESII